jgi:hypothetical protein
MGSDFLVSFIVAGKKKRLDVNAGRSALERLRVTPLEDWPREFLESQCVVTYRRIRTRQR